MRLNAYKLSSYIGSYKYIVIQVYLIIIWSYIYTSSRGDDKNIYFISKIIRWISYVLNQAEKKG